MSSWSPVRLRWLDPSFLPAGPVGLTWGVPWSKGELSREELSSLRLIKTDGGSGSGLPGGMKSGGMESADTESGGLSKLGGLNSSGLESGGLSETCRPESNGSESGRLGINRSKSDGIAICRGPEAEGEQLPLQSWATAYWPDGSVKWTAHAAVADARADEATAAEATVDEAAADKDDTADKDTANEATAAVNNQHADSLSRGVKNDCEQNGKAVSQLIIKETDDTIFIDTGIIACTVNKQGRGIIRRIVRGDNEICSGGELICIREETSLASGSRTLREEPFTGTTLRGKLEQQGPVRAVVRLDGRHRSMAAGTREWLPYTLRLYFYAGLPTIRLIYTFYYDGNPHQDFIKGLGISFAVPMRGALYNRHVRFAGEKGLFSESPKSLHTRRTKGRYQEMHALQTAGGLVSFAPEEDAYFLGLLDDSATWDSFKLVQDSSEHYRVSKRTGPGCCWVRAADGRRAGGLGYVGGEGGGLAAGLKDFWQKSPSGLEVRSTTEDEARLFVWLWSPDAPGMDLRHYDTRTHVESAYEGAEELRATPYGIANTSELTLWCTDRTPEPKQLRDMAAEAASPARLVCDPAYYYEAGAFGIWSLPDRSTPAKAYLEERLDGIIAFYQTEVEQRKWYGFWDYGDFMHSYDPVRHTWNYDLGGCAWQNTELVPNMWLWLMFLRSGREDIFRLAEAMTRHTSEVDVYHFGEYAGLGSRHNVVHWGCGCKEARIAMAGLHRYYYYLTADERIGDILDEVKDADYSTVTLDPMRAYFPKDEHPTHIRVGPDWAAFSSNWMTQWERYENAAYRDKIITGIDCIKAANFRLISGPTYGYDPKTGLLTGMGDDNWGRHLAICMGGPQVWFELAAMLEDPQWEDMLAEFGVFYNLPEEEKFALTDGAIGGGKLRFEHPVLSVAIAAYGANYRKNAAVAAQCWSILLNNDFARTNLQKAGTPVTHVEEQLEIEWMNTNEASQWSINTMISLELIANHLPDLLDSGIVC